MKALGMYKRLLAFAVTLSALTVLTSCDGLLPGDILDLGGKKESPPPPELPPAPPPLMFVVTPAPFAEMLPSRNKVPATVI